MGPALQPEACEGDPQPKGGRPANQYKPQCRSLRSKGEGNRFGNRVALQGAVAPPGYSTQANPYSPQGAALQVFDPRPNSRTADEQS